VKRPQLFKRHRIADPMCRECNGNGGYPEAHGDGGLLHIEKVTEKSDHPRWTRTRIMKWCDGCGRIGSGLRPGS
jgi:hypothetical protein